MPQKEKPKKLKTLSSTQMWSPIRDIKNGVVITKDGRFVKILEFAPINFNLLQFDEQDGIANAFGNAIRTFPKKFHIKIISRRSDVESHVRTVERYMAKERDPKCREMQMQTIQQIRRDSISGVSRRYLLSFEYEEQQSLRRPSWQEILTDIYEKADNITGFLGSSPCNNTSIGEFDDSEHAMDILYNCMCRAEAEMKSLDEKVIDVVNTYIHEHDFSPLDGRIIPINEFIAPQRIDTDHFQYVCVDGKYYCFGYIFRSSYPTECYSGWLSRFISIGQGVDIDIFVEQENTDTARRNLMYAMQISQSDYLHSGDNNADLASLESKIASGNYIREGLSNELTLLYFSIMVTVVGDSPSDALRRFRDVRSRFSNSGLDLRPLNGNHDTALLSSLPLCKPAPVVTRYAKRNILSSDFGAFYPFTSFEINDPGGIQIGRSLSNNSPLYLNLYNRYLYPNGNMAILGGSGSGKTYLTLLLCLRLRQQGKKIIIIAPWKGHEYRRACDAIGGTYITIAPGSRQNINLMEIRQHRGAVSDDPYKDYNTDISLLQTKIQQIHKFFSLRKKHMTEREEKILDEALQATYRAKGITEKNKSLYDPKSPTKFREMPTFTDLDKKLSEFKEAQGLRDALHRFVHGSCGNFAAPTNVNLNNDFVVIDVSNMPDKLLPEATFIANDYAYDTIQSGSVLEPKALVLDEASRLIGANGTHETANFVLEQTKTIRGYGGIMIIATQDTNDFFALRDGFYGQGILANSEIKMIMRQQEHEIPVLKQKMLLSETEAKAIKKFEQGQGLLIAQENHLKIRVTASPVEHQLITTNPDELKKINNS